MTKTQPFSQTSNTRLLKTSLLANAVFSGLSGSSFILMAQQITPFLDWFSPWFIIVIGIGLLGFSLFVARAAHTLNTEAIKVIILMDILWVIASTLLLITPWLAPAAKWAATDLALVVTILAVLQSVGLKRAGAKSSFSVSVVMNASAQEVWNVLADIGTISQWHPGVKASHLISDTQGLGSGRHCDLGGGKFLEEQVITWQPKEVLTFHITKTNLPMQADINFFLEQQTGGTRVEVKPEYTVSYGLLGLVLDTFFIRRNYRKGMQTLLAGLKQHVEKRA